MRSGATLADRYRSEAATAWPAAKVAFGKLSDPDLIGQLDDGTLRKLLSAGITVELTKGLKARDCRLVDRMMVALEPLPPRNMAMLLGILMEIGASEDRKAGKSPFSICPEPDA